MWDSEVKDIMRARAPFITVFIMLHLVCWIHSQLDPIHTPTPFFASRPQGQVPRLMQNWLPLLPEASKSQGGLATETHGCHNGNQGLLGRAQWMLVRQSTGFLKMGTHFFHTVFFPLRNKVCLNGQKIQILVQTSAYHCINVFKLDWKLYTSLHCTNSFSLQTS